VFCTEVRLLARSRTGPGRLLNKSRDDFSAVLDYLEKRA